MKSKSLSSHCLNSPITRQVSLTLEFNGITQFRLTNSVSINKFPDTVDAFVLFDVLSAEECDYLVSQTEELQKYSFWNLHKDNPRRDFRDADTVYY